MNEAGSDNASPDAGAVEAPVDVVAVAEGEETAAVDEVSGAAEAGDDAPAVEEMVAETAPERRPKAMKTPRSWHSLRNNHPKTIQ